MTTPRLVLDTNVCLDLFVYRDPRASALADALASGRYRAVSDSDCRDEWQRVLAYPQLGLDSQTQAQALQAYDALVQVLPEAERRPPPQTALPRCADPDDQKFLELAYAADASCLLSRDHALTMLGRRSARAGLFEIMTPQAWASVEALRNGNP